MSERMKSLIILAALMLAALVFLFLASWDQANPVPRTVPAPPLPAASTNAAIAKRPRAALAVVPPKTITIGWTYGDQTDIVFLIRACRTNDFAAPSYAWPVVGTTTDRTFTIALDTAATCVWFTVTASNTVNGLESSFATR